MYIFIQTHNAINECSLRATHTFLKIKNVSFVFQNFIHSLGKFFFCLLGIYLKLK
jgi:hypothetical protein